MKRTLSAVKSVLLLYSVVTILLIVPAGCEECPLAPSYVGSWVAIILDQGSGEIFMKDNMVYTDTIVNDLAQLYDKNSGTYNDWFKLVASFTIDETGAIMKTHITDAGLSTFSNGLPTGNITMYTENDPEFNSVLAQIGIPKIFDAEFAVNATTLIIMTDFNQDGDYNEQGETTLYDRQSD